MTTLHTETAAPPLTPIQWLICAIAAIGFAFDSYELLMLPLIVRPALADLLGAPPNSLAVNEWVGTLQYVSGSGWWHLRPAWWLSHRPARPSPRARVEHPAVRAVGTRRRVCDDRRVAAVLALLYVRRGLRRVRRRRGLAGGAVSGLPTARARCGLHAGVRFGRRPDGDRRVLPHRHLRRIVSRGARRPRSLAIHPDLRPSTRYSADRSSGHSCPNRRPGARRRPPAPFDGPASPRCSRPSSAVRRSSRP